MILKNLVPTLCNSNSEPPIESSVDRCNDQNGLIQMQVTLRNYKGSYDGIDSNGRGIFTREELAQSFSFENGQKWLVMTKILGGDGCAQLVIDGVTICSEVGEKITLRCLYSLADRSIDDKFAVTGQDTESVAENIGTLGYNLVVQSGRRIGQTVKFAITPVNGGLVYATVKSCDVTNKGDALTIIGHGTPSCTNPIINAKALTNFFTSENKIEGSWVAFKWSTSYNQEAQGLKCTIGLSENPSTTEVKDCTFSN